MRKRYNEEPPEEDYGWADARSARQTTGREINCSNHQTRDQSPTQKGVMPPTSHALRDRMITSLSGFPIIKLSIET